MNYATLGQLTKQKYPQYEGLSDEELGRRVAQKYPQYQAKITSDKEPITQPGQTLLQSAVESLLPAPSAIAKDVKASEKVPTYVNSQNDQTQKLLDLTDKIKYARSIGDKNMENEAIAESRALSNSKEDQSPNFSKQTERGDSYIGRGIKSGVQAGSYLMPAGKGANLAEVMATNGIASGAFGATQDDANIKSVIRDTLFGAGTAGALKFGGDRLGKWAAVKSSRASPAQLDAFRKITGQDLGDYLLSKGVPSSSGQTKIVEALNNEYGGLVRTGEKISKKDLQTFLDNAITKFRANLVV